MALFEVTAMTDRRRSANGTGGMQGQLDKLARGEPVNAAVAREALGLDACPKRSCVVRSLHLALHAWENDDTDHSARRVNLAVHAASVLLREM